MKTLANIFIYLAGILWTIETIPQIYKLWKTKKSKDISIAFFLICIIAYIIFIIGNIMLRNWSVVVSQIFPFVNLIIINMLIFKYRKK
jgi:MtN3 and saliva related transmembrane protein